ncbi:hypothetical protein MCRY_19850 [Marivita cryptomonadis]|nr:hypothetical protein MCRY_19850 [Marivita cryptomonadis]
MIHKRRTISCDNYDVFSPVRITANINPAYVDIVDIVWSCLKSLTNVIGYSQSILGILPCFQNKKNKRLTISCGSHSGGDIATATGRLIDV